MKSVKPSVLIYGYDVSLLETRSWVLGRNGFEVGKASHLREAEAVASARPIDLFLMCHTIPAQERRSAVAAIQAVRPQAKVMLVTTATHPVPEGPWHTVDALAGAAELIRVARRAIET